MPVSSGGISRRLRGRAWLATLRQNKTTQGAGDAGPRDICCCLGNFGNRRLEHRGVGPEKIRSRRQRYRDQDRQYHAVQRSGLGYGTIGKAQAAYFNKINAEGGINGRKINFISYDDAFSPPKAVEQARKLVESDEVLLVFQPLGTQSNSAIQKYMNVKKVPQLFVATGATKWGDPQNFPWTMGWQPNYQSEGRIYAAYILKNFPNGKIAALWQNDDAGKDQMKGLRDGLGARAGMIIADKTYEVADPTSTRRSWR